MSYQGHHQDGSGVQQHSAGPLYPYVVYIHEINDRRFWCVIGPKAPDELRFDTFDQAVEAATNLKGQK